MKKDLDWNTVSQDISEINKIVNTCNENVKEKCFELLFTLKYGNLSATSNHSIPEFEKKEEVSEVKSINGYKLPGNVLAMLRKNNLSQDELEKLFILDHEPIMPVYKIDSSKLAQAQIQKVFMILLESALSTNQFKVNYAEIRDECKEDGLVDSNFATNLKNKSDWFKGGGITNKTIDESGEVELSGTGITKLGEIIKQLSQ